MTDLKDMLELRKKIKAKKPSFLAQDTHKKKRIRKRWVRPRGRHSKIRLGKKGYRKKVKEGYSSPILVRGLHSSGLIPTMIGNTKELAQLDKAKHGIIIRASVGKRKKIDILNKAKELELKMLNIKNIEEELANIKAFMDSKKKHKETVAKVKETKAKQKEEAVKKKQDEEKKSKDELAEKLDLEEKKIKEKKEIDKVLTKKGSE